MLVPTVLRSIVLPYLRSTAANATTATSPVVSRKVCVASISSSTRHSLPAEAAATRDSSDASFRIWEPVFSQQLPGPRPPPEPPRPSRRRTPSPPDFGMRDTSRQPRQRLEQQAATTTLAQDRDVKPEPQPTPKRRNAFVPRRRGRVDVPPAVQKLLRAKLYRMAVFHIIRTPELMTNASLLVHVINVLEANSAGKLADRLRTTMDMRSRADVDPDEPMRLWSSPGTSEVQRPSTWWRLPVIPRPAESYLDATVQERRTHYYNHLITSFLTKQHSAPYASPVRASEQGPRRPLRTMQSVLKYVDHLREKQGFVPDRVTVNIIIKAWLNSMAQNTSGHGDHARAHPGRQGLGEEELRGIFEVVARTIEEDITDLARGGELGKTSVPAAASSLFGEPAKPEPTNAPTEQSELAAQETADREQTPPAEPTTPFNRAINYEHHVKPFGNMMRRAFARVGDHTGRIATERWMYRVAQRLGVAEDMLHAAVRRAGAEMRGKQESKEKK